MRIITLHSDFIEIEPKKKAIKDAEAIDKKKVRVKDCLVVLTAVESSDEENKALIPKRLASEIKDISKQVKTKSIVLYPYVHLTSNPSKPATALQVLKDTEKLLKKDKFSVTRAPFGWYKAFNIKCKGHPLSELSREFTISKDEGVSKALKAEEKLKSTWYILDTAGNLKSLTYDKKNDLFKGFDFKKFDGLKKFASYEMAKSRAVNEEPPHVALMKKLELVDYEPGSDPGNLRYYPKGRLIKGLLERFVTEKVKAYGGMEIEAPIMYDFDHPSLKSYLNRFPARQYTIQTPNKRVFLRFAACFGQFLIAHDSQISYKQLPVKLYELTKYSFRVEQHGELTGLRRLRAFTMPDCHAFCADINQAKSEMFKRFELSKQVQESIGISLKKDLEFGIRVTKNFWDNNKDFIKALVKKYGKPALIEMWDKKFFYFVLKYEWNFVDALGKASALTTDQIDIENSKRYDITYVDVDSKKQNPLILHCSPSGAIERIIYVLLEKAALDEKKGKIPTLPLWLSPTQIRFIPVSWDKHGKRCLELTEKLEKNNIRVDIDDRVESVGKRIRDSEVEWVPFTLVVGDKEAKGSSFVVRDRKNNKEGKMSLDNLTKHIISETKDMPFDSIPLPVKISKRIKFV